MGSNVQMGKVFRTPHEDAGAGLDTVFTSVSYTLRAGSHVEVLRACDLAAASALVLTGNELGNTIYGNNGHNGNAGAGAD